MFPQQPLPFTWAPRTFAAVVSVSSFPGRREHNPDVTPQLWLGNKFPPKGGLRLVLTQGRVLSVFQAPSSPVEHVV